MRKLIKIFVKISLLPPSHINFTFINKIFKNIELQYSKKNNRLMEEQSYEEIHSPSNVDTGNYD